MGVRVAETSYLMKRQELGVLDSENVEYYFYDVGSFLFADEIIFPVEVYFDDMKEESKALRLLNRV